MLLEIPFDGLFGFATLMARRMRPLPASSWPILSTKAASFGAEAAPGGPEFEEDDFAFDGSVGEFFAGVVVALKRGAGSLSLGPASAQRAARSKVQESTTRTGEFALSWAECNQMAAPPVNYFVGTE